MGFKERMQGFFDACSANDPNPGCRMVFRNKAKEEAYD